LSLNVNQLVGRFKVPFFIVIGLLFFSEISFGILRAVASLYPISMSRIPIKFIQLISNCFVAVPAAVWTQTNGSFFAAVSLGLAIFYLVTAGKIVVILKEKKSSKKRLQRVRKSLPYS
jgi:polyferredoxin